MNSLEHPIPVKSLVRASLLAPPEDERTPVFLFRDEFNDDRAAGAVNGTLTTDGKDTRVVTDTESKITISGGKLVFAGGKATPAAGDPNLNYSRVSRSAGQAILAKFTLPTNVGYMYFGFGAETSWITREISFSDFNIYVDGFLVGLYSVGTYEVVFMQRSSGHIAFIKGGTEFTNWTTMAVMNVGNTALEYVRIMSYSKAYSVDYFRLAQLPAPFNVDDVAPVDEIAGAVAAGTAFTHEADCTIEFELTTLPSGGVIVNFFRMQDASNGWYIYIGSTGSITLAEYIGGGETVRGSAAAAIANGERIVVICDDETIKVYADNALVITYTSAANFKTETSGKLTSLGTGGVVSDLFTYGRGAGAFAIDRLMGVCGAGDTFVHEADCVLEATIGLANSSGVDIAFRKQGAQDYWFARAGADGAMDLFEVVSNVATSRASAVAGSISDDGRMVVVCDDEVVKIYADDALVITYSSASNFKTATDGYVRTISTGGAVSDIITWPRHLNAENNSILERYAK